jgi:hypothetical protein
MKNVRTAIAITFMLTLAVIIEVWAQSTAAELRRPKPRDVLVRMDEMQIRIAPDNTVTWRNL